MFRKKKVKKKENLTYYFPPFPLFSERDSPSFLGLFYMTLTSEYVASLVSICKGRYKIGRVKCWLNENRTVLLPVQNESLIKENKLNFLIFFFHNI